MKAGNRERNHIVRHALLALAVALAGCSALVSRNAADSGQILALAGFQREPLQDPRLPARQLVRSGKTYRFADPEFCRCVYVGGEKEHAELERLRAERLAERDWALRHSSLGNTYSPAVWGAWKPQGLDVVEQSM
jgi:hypothetical protein